MMGSSSNKGLGKAPDPVAVLRAHRSDVNAVSFHPSSGLLLSGAADGELKIWDTRTRRPLSSARLHSPTAGIIGIATSASLDDKILSQGRDGSVKCWQLNEGGLSRQPLMTIDTNMYHFCKLSLSRSAKSGFHHEAPCSESLYQRQDTTPNPSSLLDTKIDSGSALLENGQHQAQQGMLRSAIQNALPHVSSSTLPNESISSVELPKAVSAEAVSTGQGRPLLTIAGEEPSLVEIWDIESAKRVQQLRLPSADDFDEQGLPGLARSAGMCMALQAFILPDSEGFLSVVAGYEDGSVALWDIRNPKSPSFMKRLHSEPVLSLCLDQKSRGGVSGGADDKTIFFELDRGQNSFSVKKEMVNARPGIGDIAIRNDDRIVATAGWDHRIRIHDYHRKRPLAILKYHSGSVTGVAFSDDCKMLASSSRDTTIALWSIYPPS